ncbi:hypothetical protein [Rheinheimera sp. 1928-s]|uniref:hypothetical protein n=1 Tax=Rheinheimera sp. 1928-s TaxID=3033803 RepID=UPI0026022D43|nr:hypothetical protein [Rheinheimera sp. 1928-s]MDF3127375.1 hypothetical protein [Rheinheimera sp. 1928-s]
MFQLSKRTAVWALLALVWAMVVGLALQITPDPMLHLVHIPILLVLTLGLASISLED